MFKLEDTSGFDIKDLDTYDKNYHVVRVVHESRSGYCRILEVRYSGRIFIAKTLKPEYRGSKAHLQLLTKEYEILSTLYHPSIIQTFGIVEIEGEGPGLILEYAHGVTLDNYLSEGERDLSEIRVILEQICSAVDYCHKKGVIHRDLKPSNIIVYPHGPVVKLIDFNLSHSPNYTAPPLPGGTIGFSAPEEFAPNASAAPSSDIWSIGKLMEVLNPKGDRTWPQVVEKCLDPLPENRPSSAALIPGMLNENRKVSLKSTVIISVLSLFIGIGGIFLFLKRSNTGNDDVEGLTRMAGHDTTLSLRNEATVELPDTMIPSTVVNINKEDIAGDKWKPEENGKEKVGAESGVINQNDTVAIVKSKATEMARERFKEQLAILDTATHSHTFALAKAGHWRWKAKQDMEVWLKLQSLSTTERSRLRTISGLAIKNFEEDHKSELQKAFHDAAYNRNVTSALDVMTREKNYIGGVEYIVKELDEDGVWRTYIERRD